MIPRRAAWFESHCLCIFNSSPLEEIYCVSLQYSVQWEPDLVQKNSTNSDKIIITGRYISTIMSSQEHHCIFTVIISRCYIKRLLLSSSAGICVRIAQREVSQSLLHLPQDEKEDPDCPLPVCFLDLTGAMWPSPIPCSCCLLEIIGEKCKGEGHDVQMQRKVLYYYLHNQAAHYYKHIISKKMACTNHQINHAIFKYLLRKTNHIARELVTCKYRNTLTVLYSLSQR